MFDKFYRRPTRGPCPNCGAKEGAIMASSTWGHWMSCCSDKCGLEIKHKIEKNESDPEYKKKMRQLNNLKNTLNQMRYKGIGASDPFYEL
jgi:hypothetical protein